MSLGAIAIALGIAAACGGDDSGGGTPSTGGSGGGADASTGGSGGTKPDASTGGSDAGGDVIIPGDGNVAKPVPGDIQFAAKNPLPAGEQLVFNDWNPSPNTVSAIEPDGSGETVLFEAYRLWNVGISHDATKIAFACGDPLQYEHYGLNLGDAIQHTWLYDSATQTAAVLSYGNINDECHTFNAADDAIYVCRRYDFVHVNDQYSNKGYRLGRIKVADGAFEFLTPESNFLELGPQPNADESKLYWTQIEISAGKQTNRILGDTLPLSTSAVIRENARSAALSPDGTKLIFADYTQQSALYTMTTDGQNVVKVSKHDGTSAVWSPDGSKIAYLWGETQTCSHIMVVAADGSQAENPVKVRDCGNSFVTELAWVYKP